MLTYEEIRPGIVAYFGHEKLNSDGRIAKPRSVVPRNGPFICFAIAGRDSGWVALTTQNNGMRLLIRFDWREGGKGQWATDPMSLTNGGDTYVGPNEAFVEAALGVDKVDLKNRGRLNADGLAQVVAEVRLQKGKFPG